MLTLEQVRAVNHGISCGDFQAALLPLEEQIDLRYAELPRLEKSTIGALKTALQKPEVAQFWAEAVFAPNISVRRFVRKTLLNLKKEAAPVAEPLQAKLEEFWANETPLPWANNAREAAARNEQHEKVSNAVEILLRADTDRFITFWSQQAEAAKPRKAQQEATTERWRENQAAYTEAFSKATEELVRTELGEEFIAAYKRYELPSRIYRDINEKAQNLPEVQTLLEAMNQNPWTEQQNSWQPESRLSGALYPYMADNATGPQREIAAKVRVYLWNWVETALDAETTPEKREQMITNLDGTMPTYGIGGWLGFDENFGRVLELLEKSRSYWGEALERKLKDPESPYYGRGISSPEDLWLVLAQAISDFITYQGRDKIKWDELAHIAPERLRSLKIGTDEDAWGGLGKRLDAAAKQLEIRRQKPAHAADGNEPSGVEEESATSFGSIATTLGIALSQARSTSDDGNASDEAPSETSTNADSTIEELEALVSSLRSRGVGVGFGISPPEIYPGGESDTSDEDAALPEDFIENFSDIYLGYSPDEWRLASEEAEKTGEKPHEVTQRWREVLRREVTAITSPEERAEKLLSPPIYIDTPLQRHPLWQAWAKVEGKGGEDKLKTQLWPLVKDKLWALYEEKLEQYRRVETDEIAPQLGAKLTEKELKEWKAMQRSAKRNLIQREEYDIAALLRSVEGIDADLKLLKVLKRPGMRDLLRNQHVYLLGQAGNTYAFNVLVTDKQGKPVYDSEWQRKNWYLDAKLWQPLLDELEAELLGAKKLQEWEKANYERNLAIAHYRLGTPEGRARFLERAPHLNNLAANLTVPIVAFNDIEAWLIVLSTIEWPQPQMRDLWINTRQKSPQDAEKLAGQVLELLATSNRERAAKFQIELINDLSPTELALHIQWIVSALESPLLPVKRWAMATLPKLEAEYDRAGAAQLVGEMLWNESGAVVKEAAKYLGLQTGEAAEVAFEALQDALSLENQPILEVILRALSSLKTKNSNLELNETSQERLGFLIEMAPDRFKKFAKKMNVTLTSVA